MISRRQFLHGGALASTGWLGAGATGFQSANAALSPPEPTANLPFNREVARAITAARQADLRFPGMVAGLIRRGELAGIAADGVRRVGFPDRVEVTDRFHLGSNTKAMTATWVGMAIDAGKLGWDSTLAGVFPDLASRIHPDYRRVTVDQLLSHRAGLPANIAWWGAPEGMARPPPAAVGAGQRAERPPGDGTRGGLWLFQPRLRPGRLDGRGGDGDPLGGRHPPLRLQPARDGLGRLRPPRLGPDRPGTLGPQAAGHGPFARPATTTRR